MLRYGIASRKADGDVFWRDEGRLEGSTMSPSDVVERVAGVNTAMVQGAQPREERFFHELEAFVSEGESSRGSRVAHEIRTAVQQFAVVSKVGTPVGFHKFVHALADGCGPRSHDDTQGDEDLLSEGRGTTEGSMRNAQDVRNCLRKRSAQSVCYKGWWIVCD